MYKITKKISILLACAALSCAPAFADKPDSPGNSGKKNSPGSTSANSAGEQGKASSQPYFSDNRIALINNYFTQSQASGNCPPGLAKKNNGCQPPGQAKKWQKGEKFPQDEVYYDLPSALLNELGRTPEGQKIIRVGTAVLLINAASGLIIDAIED
jgi:Ni/Co efflux regulator RcnB